MQSTFQLSVSGLGKFFLYMFHTNFCKTNCSILHQKYLSAVKQGIMNSDSKEEDSFLFLEVDL
jgi:hypothetical protein